MTEWLSSRMLWAVLISCRLAWKLPQKNCLLKSWVTAGLSPEKLTKTQWITSTFPLALFIVPTTEQSVKKISQINVERNFYTQCWGYWQFLGNIWETQRVCVVLHAEYQHVFGDNNETVCVWLGFELESRICLGGIQSQYPFTVSTISVFSTMCLVL